ncbi:MAG: glycosyltransferase [Planctomycetes bacterium]|nr:glycosyltransferase [Planctomycetota bacterium]
MGTIPTILTVVSGLTALVWLVRHVSLSQGGRVPEGLGPESPGPPADPPRVSVLLAAKDERENIGPCLQSLLAQDYPDFEVIVADDRSADGTGEVAAGIAASDPRVKVLSIDTLPEGWWGKNHAIWTASRAATGAWLCTVDADCRQTSPRTLSAALGHAVAHEVDMLSILPVLRMQGFWENVVQPVCGAVLVYWYQPQHVNDPARPEAYANGTLMLIRREVYDAVGGHEAIRGEMMEDLRLAARVKGAGRRLRVTQNEGLYEVRMYPSLADTMAGWSRIFWGAFPTRRRLRLTMIVLALISLSPYVLGLWGWLAWLAGGSTGWLVAASAATAAAAVQLAFIARLYPLLKARRSLFWTWPLGCVLALVALARAYRFHRPGGAVVWRSTTYKTAD